METLGAIPDDGEWECFRRIFASEDHDDSPPQLLDQTSLLLGENNGNFGVQSMFCSLSEAEGNMNTNGFYSFDSHINYNSQESNHSTQGHTNYYFDCSDHVLANNSDRTENFDHNQVQPKLKLKRMLDVPEFQVHVEDKINSCGNPKKKPRAAKDVSLICLYLYHTIFTPSVDYFVSLV